MNHHYPHPVFKERMLEYIEDSVYLVGFGKYLEKSHFQTFKSVRTSQLDWLLEKDLDIFTSVWQKNSYLIVLDVEYYNPSDYSEIFMDEEGVFTKMEAFCEAVENVLEHYDIDYIKLMTGQGYHYASKIQEGSPAFKLFVENGWCSETTHMKNPDVPPTHNLVHDACGKLMEFLYQKVFEIYPGNMESKDIKLSESMMVLDLDLWADPLFMRDVRLVFSSHQKHIMEKYIRRMGSDWCAKNLPIGYSLPCKDLTLEERCNIRRNRDKVIELAKRSSVHVPFGDNGWGKMFNDYLCTPLREFHEQFELCDVLALEPCLPGSIPFVDEDILTDSTSVRWTEIKRICDASYRKGISAQHLARFFYDIFTAHPQWKLHWVEYDPLMRAKYWVRIFYGMNVTLEGYRPLLE